MATSRRRTQVKKSTASKRRRQYSDEERKPGESRGERDYSVNEARKPCRKCGSHEIAWQMGSRGNWYLTEIFEDANGRSYTERALFHSEFCGNPGAHEEEQALRIEQEVSKDKERKNISRARIEKENATEAEYFLALHDLCKNNRPEALDQLGGKERELERELSSPVSMDYLTEHVRYRARVDRLKAEVNFMKAALGMTTYEEVD